MIPASLPPAGLPGLDPRWSRLVDADDAEGVRRTWHVLDTGVAEPVGTLLALHGNPTWSYLWRHLLAAAPPGWRVVAPDQLGMGWSERPEQMRRLAQRVGDLGNLTDALGVTGPVVTVGHDWGGPISLGWALDHRDALAGLVLANTAVHLPAGYRGPTLIRLARSPALLRTVCERTPTFVRAASAVSRPPLPAPVRAALAAPYRGAARRTAVRDFVADIPLDVTHPSAARLIAIADGLPGLASVPALVLWGPSDPVFAERDLADLLARLQHAQVHRYEGAGHLLPEDRPGSAAAIADWASSLGRPAASPAASLPAGRHGRRRARAQRGPVRHSLWSVLEARGGDSAPAVVELGAGGVRRTVSFALLAQRVRELAAGLVATGVRRGERVALLVPPGADLTAAVYACWRAGAVVVLADAGLGLRAMGRALRAAAPDHVVGIPRGLAAAQLMRLPGRRIAAGPLDQAGRRVLGAAYDLADLARIGRATTPEPPEHDLDAECAVVFTSGATGPAKGVVYRQRQVLAQLDALRATYDITPQDRFVAAFAPFALYGPALGIPTAVPSMDVTAPGSLRAAALAEAVSAVDATLVFASPAALHNVVASGSGLDARQRRALELPRLVLSAGAPVPAALLREVSRLLPAARVHTPYGMTEALPVTDISLEEIDKVGPGDGVCVGRPVPGVELAVSPLSADGRADGPLTDAVGVSGEVCVRAAHVKGRYDRLWVTERASSRDPGWHRTGDVGHVDEERRLWVEGRLVHVITTAAGAVTPVGPELRIQDLPGVRAAAVVGVGPPGTQVVVAVVVPETPPPRGRVADLELTDAVRAVAGVPVAAVLLAPRLPVDIRHNAKVDRAQVAAWADAVLAGKRPRRR